MAETMHAMWPDRLNKLVCGIPQTLSEHRGTPGKWRHTRRAAVNVNDPALLDKVTCGNCRRTRAWRERWKYATRMGLVANHQKEERR